MNLNPQASAVRVTCGVYKEITDADLRSAIGTSVPIVQVGRLGSFEVGKLVSATETMPKHVSAGQTRFRVVSHTTRSHDSAPNVDSLDMSRLHVKKIMLQPLWRLPQVRRLPSRSTLVRHLQEKAWGDFTKLSLLQN